MPGHAEMDDQRAVIKSDQQIFAASPCAAYRAPGQALRQIGRKRPAQATVAQRNGGDGTAFQIQALVVRLASGATPRRVTSTSGNSGMLEPNSFS